MAFVAAPGQVVARNNSFTGCALDSAPIARVASVRMEADKEPSEFGKAGNSMWKENPFTGGMPGGETFYKAWVEDGMTKDFPDMPESLQAKSEFKPTKSEKGGVLGMLDNLEFFSGFSRDPEPTPEDTSAEEVTMTDAVTVSDEDEAPSESLYAPYFPASIRNIAPEISITYEKNVLKDRVSLAMTEVSASPTDIHFPKEMKNKAPIIDISYNGNLSTAYVSVELGDVDGLPTLAPPPKEGDAVTSLVPGSGGGLKLDYTIAGAGSVNI